MHKKQRNKIGHVHVADSDRWYPGHAHYDFESTFAALKDSGIQGAVALESFLYPDLETAARRRWSSYKHVFAEHWNKLTDKRDCAIYVSRKDSQFHSGEKNKL